MATLASLTNDVEEVLYGTLPLERPHEDTQVTASINDTATEVEFTDNTTWKRGMYAEFTSDGELVILAADHPAAASTVTIRRGQRGTTAGTHVAGAVVRRDPLFPIGLIERNIAEVIDNELWPDLYSIAHRTTTFDDTNFIHELAAADHDVLEVYQRDTDNNDRKMELDKGSHSGGSWFVIPVTSTTVSSTGKALEIRRVFDDAKTVFYTAAQRPLSSDIASIDTRIAELVPRRAAALTLLDRAAVIDRLRSRDDAPLAAIVADRWTRGFLGRKNDLKNILRRDVPKQKTYAPRIGGSPLVTRR